MNIQKTLNWAKLKTVSFKFQSKKLSSYSIITVLMRTLNYIKLIHMEVIHKVN